MSSSLSSPAEREMHYVCSRGMPRFVALFLKTRSESQLWKWMVLSPFDISRRCDISVCNSMMITFGQIHTQAICRQGRDASRERRQSRHKSRSVSSLAQGMGRQIAFSGASIRNVLHRVEGARVQERPKKSR